MISNAKSISFWEYEELLGDIDVVIIGAGIVGLLTAYYLKLSQPNWKIIILEASNSGAGASTKNAGFACIGSLGEIIADNKVYGETATLDLVSQRVEGLERLKSIVGEDQIEYENKSGCELFISQNEFIQTADYIDYWNNLIKCAIFIMTSFKYSAKMS